jgi:hypothetical protein
MNIVTFFKKNIKEINILKIIFFLKIVNNFQGSLPVFFNQVNHLFIFVNRFF